MLSPITILDCNNFWSPSGGGVRRYHLQKLEYFKNSPNNYVFMMQDDRDETEVLNETTIIEHIRAPKWRGNWDYRFLTRSAPIRALIQKHNPHVIEVGSPYIMPFLVKRAVHNSSSQARLLCFWHADFPVTYVGRFFEKWGASTGKGMENLAWLFARRAFSGFSGFMVSSLYIGARMTSNGLGPVNHVPLGVDSGFFRPENVDRQLLSELKAGNDKRLTIFFPHRFMEEKGLRTLLKAYPGLCRQLGLEPALVFAGTGPDMDMVKNAARTNDHIRYIGFISDRSEMAKWYATCEMALALSGHETFGLSILESMASGQVLVGADTGAASEHVKQSQAGVTIPVGNPQALIKAVAELQGTMDKSMSKKAVDYARTFTWENCFKKEEEVYKNAIGNSVRPK
jgi:alpha-1,6-mannosyltransferase